MVGLFLQLVCQSDYMASVQYIVFAQYKNVNLTHLIGEAGLLVLAGGALLGITKEPKNKQTPSQNAPLPS